MVSLVSDLAGKFCHRIEVLLKHSEELRAVIWLYRGLGVHLSQDFSNSFLKGLVLHPDKIMLFRGEEYLLAHLLLLLFVLIVHGGLL